LLVRLVLFSVIKINHLAEVGHSWNPRIAWVSRISVPPLRRVTANPCPFRKLKPAQDRRRTHAPCSARIAQFGQPDMATSQCRFFLRRRDWQISGLVNGRFRGSLGIGGRNASACVAAGGTRLHSTLDNVGAQRHHSSQMNTVGPAISFRTSCWLLPQNVDDREIPERSGFLTLRRLGRLQLARLCLLRGAQRSSAS
jgi:hypothetical protein